MRNVLLVTSFLVLNSFAAAGSAQAMEAPLAESASQTPTMEVTVDLATELAVYSLIAGIYGLYWLKQRA